MDRELIRLIGSYVVAVVILGFGGYMLVATGEIPAPWDNLVTIAAGFLFLADGIQRSVTRRNNRRD
jgi:hypothetical protein